jgi:hypothetical protein
MHRSYQQNGWRFTDPDRSDPTTCRVERCRMSCLTPFAGSLVVVVLMKTTSPESVADAADSLDAVGNGAEFPAEAANHDVDRVAATVVTRAPYLAE